VAKVLSIVTMENLVKAIKSDVPSKADDNAAAAQEAYKSVSDVVQL